jgi:hypothetical protein
MEGAAKCGTGTRTSALLNCDGLVAPLPRGAAPTAERPWRNFPDALPTYCQVVMLGQGRAGDSSGAASDQTYCLEVWVRTCQRLRCAAATSFAEQLEQSRGWQAAPSKHVMLSIGQQYDHRLAWAIVFRMARRQQCGTSALMHGDRVAFAKVTAPSNGLMVPEPSVNVEICDLVHGRAVAKGQSIAALYVCAIHFPLHESVPSLAPMIHGS